MFDHLFNRNDNAGVEPAKTVEPSPEAAPVSAEETQVWHERIQAAAGVEPQLLQILHEAPTVALKLDALHALKQEESYRQALHDVRDQDKRLYRAAKTLWETSRGRRIATEEANGLIAAARALLEQSLVPVNRVVELDRAWAALDGSLVDAALAAEFAALSMELGAKVRARGEHVQALNRWLGAIDGATASLQTLLPGVAQGATPPADLESLAVALLELAQNVPDAADPRCIEKTDAANRLLALASSVVERAKFLQALPAAGSADEAAEKALIEQWRGYPDIPEGELHTVLAERFADWRNADTQHRQQEHETLTTQQREKRAEQNRQRVEAIQRDIEAAETAHAGGHVGDLTRLLGTIDQALKRGPVNATLTRRIEVLRAEQRRLHDWQRWSGGQGREQLVSEAQALAQEAAGKINLKTHADAINKLRERWKELDKLGGASRQAVWLAFDAALETAYAPVAAQLEKLRIARNENLAAREAVIAGLAQAAGKYFPAAPEGSAPATPDWRAVAHSLEESQTAWRKLGPVEHTVPRKALQGENAVTKRYAAAVQALEAPLKQQYGDARARREQLIAAARELAASDVMARDVVDKVRKIQSQWQNVAKSQPLPRRDENALWTGFKAATDGIFAARDAARAAAEAAVNAQQQARVEIIERVAALARAATAAEIRRGMADADTAWRAAPEVPKPQAAKLDARYRAARDAASKRIGELAARAAQARYDVLLEATALCAERETLQDAGTADDAQNAALQARWDAIDGLPDAWRARMAARFDGNATTAPTPKSAKTAPASLEDVLLNLEVACGIDSPTEFQAARQMLKIRALKNAMEGRQTATTTPADIERWLLDAAATPRPNDAARERLARIIAAVRRRSSSV